MPRLEALGVSPEVARRLRDCELRVTTVERLWVHDAAQLSEQTQIPLKTLEELRAKCALKLCPQPTINESCRISTMSAESNLSRLHPTLMTAEEELNHHQRNCFVVSSGCRSLDSLLERGGFETRQLTEVVGPSASGKTQLCLTLAVRVAAKQGDVIYIDANGSACPRRLKQMASDVAQKDPARVNDILRRIRVLRLFNESQLIDALDLIGQKMLAADPEYQDLRMVVVDPIKTFLSPTLQNRDGRRNGHFIVGVVGRALNYLALRYGLLVLVTNGTLAERGGGDSEHNAAAHAATNRPGGKATLGPSWALFPSLRLLLGVASEGQQDAAGANTGTTFHATVAAAAAQATGGRALFRVGQCGIKDVMPPSCSSLSDAGTVSNAL